MQQLHLVGLTTDHTGLVLSARRGAKTGKYTVTADEKLLAAVQEAQRIRDGGEPAEEPTTDDDSTAPPPAPVPLPPEPPAKRVSLLSPREIQARLRAGGAVSEIADAAGVDEEWILRFADPIRAEQGRVVETAQALTFNKTRLGLSAEPLAASVQLNLAERGLRLPDDVFEAAWTAYNLHGTKWAVRFSYTSRKRRQSAHWEVDLRSGELTARNRLASDLAYLEPGRRRRRVEPLELAGPEETQAGPHRPSAKAATTKASSGTRALADTAGANDTNAPPVKKAPAKKAPAKKASAAKKVPAPKQVVVPKKVAVAEKLPAAKKGGGRQSSPRPRRPAKKPSPKKPTRSEPSRAELAPRTAPVSETLPERPTHLARPPSPMNRTNRAVTVPGRLVGAPSLRPPVPPAPIARARARSGLDEGHPRAGRPLEEPRQRQATPPRQPQPDVAAASTETFAPRPVQEQTGPGEARDLGGEETSAQGGDESMPRARRRRSERRIAPRTGDQPSVVIMSTPAVRRLDPENTPDTDAPPSPS